jgi:hypothetical protein
MRRPYSLDLRGRGRGARLRLSSAWASARSSIGFGASGKPAALRRARWRGASRRRRRASYLAVEADLLPTLGPSHIVVMDNLGSHKGKVVRQLARSAGAKLFFLPKYSPDLNPIEQAFAKLRAFPD